MSKMGRPRTLPPFNAHIPEIFFIKYTTLLPAVEIAVGASRNKAKHISLMWLRLHTKIVALFPQCAMLEGRNKLTNEEWNAMMWAKHQGKWRWEDNVITLGATQSGSKHPQAEGGDKKQAKNRSKSR